ncbi:hypothetical protein GGX14DRAFT_676825 [Mycena pura]|uniref:WD40 repeat-like protein n=1 Tax=Mycena pura TaxID=153505 RepID=A0AAD6UWZ1_9AGAR|nr:hypothetical protein GGX14DRAFT_676825 [Mycena pura]
MPPKDLPGLYWDPARNRYFPLSARPPSSAPCRSSPAQDRVPLWSPTLATATTAAARARHHPARAHRSDAPRQSRGNPVAARERRRTTPTRQFLGDARGWLYSRALAHEYCDSAGDWDADVEAEWTSWTPELCLGPDSETSAICTTQTPTSTRCVAVCFGHTTRICVQNADTPDRTSLLSLSAVRDVRAASLSGAMLVLGAARSAVVLSDLDASGPVRTLPTASDVFATAQHETLVYAGTRGGAVLRFDVRTPTNKPSAHVVAESSTAWDSATTGQRSSVTFLHSMRDGRAHLVGFMDGRLGMLDLRFARRGAPPAVAYAGHVNATSPRLGTALDPTERLLFAAGEDRRLRAWAVDSGVPLHPDAAPLPDTEAHAKAYKPFHTRFPAPLAALQVDDDAMLWAAGGGTFWRWRLGL